jgi:hypothetical protein
MRIYTIRLSASEKEGRGKIQTSTVAWTGMLCLRVDLVRMFIEFDARHYAYPRQHVYGDD